jgi:hypothetical protein
MSRKSKEVELEFHPIANLFPLMEGSEFDALVADIKANGLREQIVLYEGMILDGRNRYRALRALGISPTEIPEHPFGSFCGRDVLAAQDPGKDPAGFVVSRNIHRRHLTAERRRALIAELIKAQPEKSDREIAREAKVDHVTVGKVRKAKEATGEVSPVERRTGADGKARKQPAKKPAPPPEVVEQRHQARALKQERARARARARKESGECHADISRFAYKLIQLDIEIARELYRVLVMNGGDAMQLMDDLADGIKIEETGKLNGGGTEIGNGADPAASADEMKAKFAALERDAAG